MTWLVILKTGDRLDQLHCYGPFDDEMVAQRFAEYLTKEVDPAIRCPLRDPTLELMNWIDSQ
jgi:hypothetical protein